MPARLLSHLLTIFAVAVTLAMPAARAQQSDATRIVTFEIDATELEEPIAEAAQSPLTVLDRRLNGAGRTHVTENNQIEVELYGALTPEQFADLLRRITAVGRLEFRITASRQFKTHQSFIELAEELPVDQTSVRLNDREVVRWVECDGKEFPSLEETALRGLVARKAGDSFQALVVTNDGFDVTGDYLKSVTAGLDQMAKPQLNFSFNPRGAFLFGQLTGNHLPNAGGQRYNLGIVLDDHLLSAPTIHDKITERGTISGNMSQADVDFLVAILNAGSLPYPLRLVAERSIAK